MTSALRSYREEVQRINTIKVELMRQENDAWTQLLNVVNDDKPSLLSNYFRYPKLHEEIHD